jgi:uncharacterized cupin superfamily protein
MRAGLGAWPNMPSIHSKARAASAMGQSDGTPNFPIALDAAEVPPRATRSVYPEPFASAMGGRVKRILGDAFGLSAFGVNLTQLQPGGVSSMRHAHSRQDEFVYILQGCPTLHTDAGMTPLRPGMCAGFRGGSGDAHRLLNQTDELVVYLEVGDRAPGDAATYPDDDLEARHTGGHWRFFHKNGDPYL